MAHNSSKRSLHILMTTQDMSRNVVIHSFKGFSQYWIPCLLVVLLMLNGRSNTTAQTDNKNNSVVAPVPPGPAPANSFADFINRIDTRIAQTKHNSDKAPNRYFQIADSVLSDCLRSKELITSNYIDTLVIHYVINIDGFIELQSLVNSKREPVSSEIVEECVKSIRRFNREGEVKDKSGSNFRYIAVLYFIVEDNQVR